jgi:Secretion system C-terminal sorting domain
MLQIPYLMKVFTLQQQPATKRNLFLPVFLLFFAVKGFSQYNVTEIITDYGGYWKSSAALNNTVKPDNSHNLVSFSFNGKRYSTGVNDALLTANGQSFIAGDYKALPVHSINGTVNSNTKIGLGSMYDGVANGPGTPRPSNDIPKYLTDGIKGLDLGTCVANLPAGTLFFSVSNIRKQAIGDGTPDIVITQIADPSGSLDRYEFTDINGNRVGNYVDIVLSNIPAVGNWTADFYEASTNPMTLSAGFTKTDRPIRLWASDLSAFGIDSSNSSQIAYFKISLSGNSDVAFVAYNNNTIDIQSSLLAVKLSGFAGKPINKDVQLSWETLTEINSDAFFIERSADGSVFTAVDKVNAAGNSFSALEYVYIDKNAATGKNFYRLKQVDRNGGYEYSKIIEISTASSTAAATINMFPNPAVNYVTINHPFAGNNEVLQILNFQGNILLQQRITAGSFQTRIDLPRLPAGVYQLVWNNGKDRVSNNLLVL